MIKTKQKTPPAVEPVTLTELKDHLRIDSGTYATTVFLDAGTCATGGVLNAKIQESDDNTNWSDWTGGAFTAVTPANDNAVYEKAYTGEKIYIRVIAAVTGAACEFSTSIVKVPSAATAADDTLLASLITAARQYVEQYLWRVLITQTWYGYLDSFPCADRFIVPFGNLQSVTSLKYKDSAGTVTVMTPVTDYLVDADSDPGQIVLPYSGVWPAATLYPVNPITIEFVCGYGAAGTSVPEAVKIAVKLICAHYYENRELFVIGQPLAEIPKTAERLLAPYRLNTV